MLLITGAAGFIGYSAARLLLEAGADVVGIDEINGYYNPALKRGRLDALQRFKSFRFLQADIAEAGALEAAAPAGDVTHILHLAAQAGVRYSLKAPMAYEHANVKGHLRVLEYARSAERLRHLTYASSSSVYGDRTDGPFRETDRCDQPASLYAATKRACELMSETYARLYGIAQTGLRFFTAYGAWGRPDMAYWLFTDAILKGEPVTLYGEGKLARDFTYIGDMAPTIARIIETPPADETPPHVIVNLGNSAPSTVNDLVDAIKSATGKRAERVLAARNPVEVTATYADITQAGARYGFAPRTSLQEGIRQFVEWRRAHPEF